MSRQNKNLDHLRGLKRVSPCCLYEVFHPNCVTSNYPACIVLECKSCGKRFKEHWLINDRGEVVWPPPQEWVDRQPPAKRRKRCRRKVLLEQDPEPYRILY